LATVALEKTYAAMQLSPGSIADAGPMLDPELRRIEEDKSLELLSSSSSEFALQGITCISHVLVERSWESVSFALVEEAKKLRTDFMVVASSGKSWPHLLLEGSLTAFCVKHSTVPVLVLPPPSRWEMGA
jgi:nucleotide-binding universal stress UspA family protein